MNKETFRKKVDGMICPQCEDEIAQALIHMRGVLAADASYRKSEVTLEYAPDIISAESIEKKLSDIGYPAGEGKSGIRSDIISAAAVVLLYFAVPVITGMVDIPQAERGASFGLLFMIGVLTGAHCLGMCGGIMLTQNNALMYNGTRLISYTIVGAVFGAMGTVISYDTEFKSMLLTMCGLLVVIIGLMMWGVPVLRRISPGITKPCRFRGGPAIVGLLTGLMPCGALTAMWMFAAASGSWRSGAASMFAFGMGTCVLMIFFGMFGKFIPKRYNKYITRVSTVLIVTLGLLLMTKGLKLL
jgi:sulfite exporter TauE/SafE/copper chaperone CopZ